MNKQSRNLGIDILRIVSMMGVVLLHVLGRGGLLKAAPTFPAFSLLWFLEVLAFPAVNCFVLISGYVGYRKEKYYPRLKNIISLLFLVLFYNVSITLLFKLVDPSIGVSTIITASRLFATSPYWFFTEYFALFLLMPLLNLMVHTANKKQLFIAAIALLFFSTVSLIADPFILKGGYSVIWLACVYTVGAVIKKYDLTNILSTGKWLLLTLVSFLVTWLPQITIPLINVPTLKDYSSIFIAYTSPTVILMAIGWLSIFSKFKGKHSLAPVVTFFSTSAFSVYLIHEQLYIRKWFISRFCEFTAGYSTLRLLLFVLCMTVTIFMCCILIDKVRLLLFRLLKIDRLSEYVEKWIKYIINALYRKVKV